ncbi:peptide chain release factor N(5)-glutamine methyltransferase [Neofamilia massiliensis]|uniref:peptide chain release factor N(5)-glutamine methyltransferase n=1 Tax=Neofamilia massiliensis TaxID=1673724 RepID=UPI0006BB88A2|nr:peptide chain release factor N(5)-glutamine methyltransferase [Neofamilia massiliensis]
MVIREAIEFGKDKLKDSLYTDPIKESRFILSFLLNKDLSFILINPDYELEEKISEDFTNIIIKRQAGQPLAYLLKTANFYGRDFYVDQRVLIPRWDTENLVEQVLDLAKTIESPEILEIGAGSGAISITMGLEIPEAKINGVDISDEALEVCNINLERYKNSKVKFFKSNLYENISGHYDIIISNPPYIKRSDLEDLQREVKNEPLNALDGGEDGLDFYRDIIKFAKDYLKESAYLVFELGAGQYKDVKNILLANNFSTIGYKKDLQGIIRVIWAS